MEAYKSWRTWLLGLTSAAVGLLFIFTFNSVIQSREDVVELKSEMGAHLEQARRNEDRLERLLANCPREDTRPR